LESGCLDAVIAKTAAASESKPA